MFPVHTIPTRMGIEQGLRGAPHRGPGRYDPDPVSPPHSLSPLVVTPSLQVTLFLQPLDSRPRSKRGWYFGASLAVRLPTQAKVTIAMKLAILTQCTDKSVLCRASSPAQWTTRGWSTLSQRPSTDHLAASSPGCHLLTRNRVN